MGIATNMEWWQDPVFADNLIQVLSHVNEATDRCKDEKATNICELYFKALNKLWNGFAHHQKGSGRADIPSFIALLKSLSENNRLIVLRSQELKHLIVLTPDVMNHSVLKKHECRPGEKVPSKVQREAIEEHRKLRNSHFNFLSGNPDFTTDAVLEKLAEFLFVVRSNIAHGEKTPYGPDKEKTKRDEKVSGLVVPVQQLLVDLILDRPSRKLVAYGTLRPGGPNEKVLEGLKGTWNECLVHGSIREDGGLFHFNWDLNANPIEAWLFESPDLADSWEQLDRFEGSRYRRHLVPVVVKDVCIVANVFGDRYP